MSKSKTPRIFISYSHNSNAHRDRIGNLAKELVKNGVNVETDHWSLVPGNDGHAYMEEMVNNPSIDKVIMILDKQYVEKANKREKGVGIETMIISAELYGKNSTKQEKFIPVFWELNDNGDPYLPTYCKNLIGIDMSEGKYQDGFDQLLRIIHNEPQYKKPDLGNKPDFSGNKIIKPSTDSFARQLCDHIRAGKSNANVLIEEYFNIFSEDMKQLFFDSEIGKKDNESNYDLTINSIDNFLPSRNEVAGVFLCIASDSRGGEDFTHQVHKFFENLIPYYDQHKGQGYYFTTQSDNLVFLIHEMFLYAIAAFIKAKNFKGVAYLTNTLYHVPNPNGSETMISFTNIGKYAESFRFRNQNKKLGRMSLRADILMERADTSEFSRQQIIQADTCLEIKDFFIPKSKNPDWCPETLLHSYDCTSAFEIFARAQSRKHFEKIKIMWETEQSGEITPTLISSAIDKIHEDLSRYWPRWDGIGDLIEVNKLCQYP